MKARHNIAGVKSPECSKHHKFYAVELKHAAVKDFLSGHYSLRDITRKYQIFSKSALNRWTKLYNEKKFIEEPCFS
ncbi:hypothetical protein AU387_06680 [Bacillus halotolerans]|nr:hypothetical protein AU387_06680 [Bacillus halotolerans]